MWPSPVFVLAFLLKLVSPSACPERWGARGAAVLRSPGPRIDATHITGFFVLDGLLTREWDAAWDAIGHLILPAIALGTIPLAVIFRITRASVLDVLNEDYVRTAEAKGLTHRTIRGRHVLRNALLPVITMIGLQTGALLAGAVLTETVFDYSAASARHAVRGRSAGRTTRCCRCSSCCGAVISSWSTCSSTCRTRVIDPRIRTR